MLSAIVEDTPPSVTDRRQDLPREVGRIVKRCLAKDPEERYQTAKELRNDLRLLARELDAGATATDRTATRAPQIGFTPAPSQPTRRGMPIRPAVAALLAVVATVAGIGAWWYARRPGTTALPATPAFSTIAMRRLTNTGKARIAAISPDGRYLVHDDGSLDKPGLWTRQVSTSSSVQITPAVAGRYDALTFSPDGEAVLYVFSAANAPFPSLFRIPLLGGPARTVVENISTAPAFSPDGTRMAFIRRTETGCDVVLANADGTAQRRLSSRPASDAYALTRMAWSPDGTRLAAFAGQMPAQKARVVLVDVPTGRQREFGDARFDSGGDLTWLGDGTALVFDAIERYGGRWNWNSKLWSLASPAGTLRRITSDLANYMSAAATAGGRTVVALRDETRAGLWVAPAGDTARARPVTDISNAADGATGVDWTPDGASSTARSLRTAGTSGSQTATVAGRNS